MYFFYYLVFIFCFIIHKGKSDIIGGNPEGICPLTITQIYGDPNSIYLPTGEISNNFKENTESIFISEENVLLDKFFITETIKENTTFNSISIIISSDNETLLKPTYSIYQLDLVSSNTTKVNSLEITYNCERLQMGETKIRLKFKPDKCKEFEMIWKKKCKGDLYGKPPIINLAFSTSDVFYTLIENGNIPLFYDYFFNKERSLNTEGDNIIINDNIKFIISLADNTLDPIPYKMNPIKLNPNNDQIVSNIIKGDIGNFGGQLNNIYQEFYILFSCKMKKDMKSDYKLNYELEFSFDNGQKITVYFNKICKVPRINYFLGYLYLIYYTFLVSFIIIFALLIIFFYGSRDEDFTSSDFIFNIKQKFFVPIIEKMGLNQYFQLNKSNKKEESGDIGISNQITKNKNDNEIQMDNGDEEEVLSIKFSTENNNENNDDNQYGGL